MNKKHFSYFFYSLSYVINYLGYFTVVLLFFLHSQPMEFNNKNEKQIKFNETKGVIVELNDAVEYCSITLGVGHESSRFANFSVRKMHFDKIAEKHKLGDRVTILFYPDSIKKPDRWYTKNIILSVQFE